ncbi:hypothetical protein F2Q69_00022883 [Brassica cretica]|uniref:Uncharacterized protein n=1 Tax=Brassica cretica TaxID=69181 RepID=A0A8S9Q2X2_BRACR|nr:hypothetical protein F2Q69_00022883 [Brassica cretica]
MAIDTAELLGLKMEPSKDSFTFVDSSRVNSAGMIKNVKVEIGECIIPVDFHAMDIKSGKTSPLLFGRAFMATVGAVCDLKRNKMCLTNVDETIFYDPMEKRKSEELISCIEMFEDSGPTADSNRQPAIPESASVDIRTSASVNFQYSESIDTKPSASIILKILKWINLSTIHTCRDCLKEPKLTSNTKPDTTACLGACYTWDQILQTSLEELHRRVRCLAMDGDLPTVRLSPTFDTR